MSLTVEEWRDARMPYFTSCQEALERFFRNEIARVAKLLEFKAEAFTYSTRIKEAASAARTAERTRVDYWKLNDWVGARLSCPTLEAAYHLSVAVNSFDEWTPGKRHDHNVEPEIDGYRGIHVYGEMLRPEQGDAGDLVRVPCEVQLHTRLQSVWAELTHDDVYKPTRIVSVFVHDTAANLAAYMAATDLLFERTLKVLRDPESQLQPVGAAEIRHWISVLASIDAELDWYDIQSLVGMLRSVGITTTQQVDALRAEYPGLANTIRGTWERERSLTPTTSDLLFTAGRLLVERIRHQDIERKVMEWMREEVAENDPAAPEDAEGEPAMLESVTNGE